MPKLRAIRRTALTGFIVFAMAMAGLLLPASPAQAGTATCNYTIYYNSASGGCAHHGHASRRMWVTCKTIGSHFGISRATGWHWGSNICWGDSIGCGVGNRATKVWFEVGQ